MARIRRRSRWNRPIQYDLYRIPFNGGKGRPAEGALRGRSNNGNEQHAFPKVSPDGRWIVYVQSRNGQLMRPDGQLYIVPSGGGQARRMRCNTALMNSWHSFSPNGRWLVFSSEEPVAVHADVPDAHRRGAVTTVPAILIENSTARKSRSQHPGIRQHPAGWSETSMCPARRVLPAFDSAWNLAEKGRFDESIVAVETGAGHQPRRRQGAQQPGPGAGGKGAISTRPSLNGRRALEINPQYWEAHNNLAVALLGKGMTDEATAPQAGAGGQLNYAEVHGNLGRAAALKGKSGGGDRGVAEGDRTEPQLRAGV